MRTISYCTGREKKNRQLHVIVIYRKQRQIASDTRKSMSKKPGSPERYDYEYVRKGKANIFVAVEFKTGKRITRVTKRRTMKDFAMFVKEVFDRYLWERKLHIVLDNLNTYFAGSFEKTFGEEQAKSILQRIVFHYTPKHASWLNVAEIEINVMDIECTNRRFESFKSLDQEVSAWTRRRNRDEQKIKWGFDRIKAG
jgi:hypothetical protein